MDLIGRVDVNIMMKEFPIEKQLTIWWVNLDQLTLNKEEIIIQTPSVYRGRVT
jgi:hypothetical protein